jgi:hypothetical protein
MKKPIVLTLVLALAAATGVFFFRQGSGTHGPRHNPAEWLPVSTYFFLHVPDIPRTLERWKGTSLHEIAAEPQWQEFVQQLPPDLAEQILPPASASMLKVLYQQWKAIDPVEIFFAELQPENPASKSARIMAGPILSAGSSTFVTGSDGSLRINRNGGVPIASVPGMVTSILSRLSAPVVVGVRYRGRKSDVKASVERVRAELFQGLAAPASVLVKVAGAEVEQLTAPGAAAAFAYVDDWIFFATGTEPLKELLQRYAAGAGGSAGLAGDAQYAAAEHLALAEPDVRIFYQSAARSMSRERRRQNLPAERVLSEEEWDRLDETVRQQNLSYDPYLPETAGYTLKLDGRLVRDRCYLRLPKFPQGPPLQSAAGRWASAQCSTCGAIRLGGREDFLRELWAAGAAGRFLRASPLSPLAAVTPDEPLWSGTLGAELAWQFEPEAKAQDRRAWSFLTTFHDHVKARTAVEVWARRREVEHRFLEGPGGPEIWVSTKNPESAQPAFGRAGAHVVFSSKRELTERALRLVAGDRDSLGQTERFQTAMKKVSPPTVGWLYVDLPNAPTLLNNDEARVYLHASTTTSFPAYPSNGMALKPLPMGDSVRRHFLPLAVSITEAPQGLLVESAGSFSVGAVPGPGFADWFGDLF